MIRKEAGKFVVRSHDTTKILGIFHTEKEALEREALYNNNTGQRRERMKFYTKGQREQLKVLITPHLEAGTSYKEIANILNRKGIKTARQSAFGRTDVNNVVNSRWFRKPKRLSRKRVSKNSRTTIRRTTPARTSAISTTPSSVSALVTAILTENKLDASTKVEMLRKYYGV